MIPYITRNRDPAEFLNSFIRKNSASLKLITIRELYETQSINALEQLHFTELQRSVSVVCFQSPNIKGPLTQYEFWETEN